MLKISKLDLSESHLIIAKMRQMIGKTRKKVTESRESQLETTQQIEKASEIMHRLQSETWRWLNPRLGNQATFQAGFVPRLSDL